ncbi:MAG: TolC family protein [Chitinophagales bacterium]
MHNKFFRYITILAVIAALLACPTTVMAADNEQPQVLTLEQATNIALQHSPSLKTAVLDIDKAENQKEDATDAVEMLDTSPVNAPYANTAGLATYSAYLQANMGYEAAKKNVTTTTDQIKLDMYDKYYAVVEAIAQVKSCEKNLVRDERQNRVTQAMKLAGLTTDADAEKVRTAYLSSKTSLDSANKSLESAWKNFNLALGSKQVKKYALEDPKWQTIELGTVESEITKALNSSTDLWKVQMAAEIADQTKYLTDSNEISSVQAGYTVESTKNALTQSASSAYWSLISMEEQKPVLEKSISVSETSLKTANLRYKLGVGTYLEVLQAEASLESAKNQLLNVECQHAALVAKYIILTGRTLK